jgi:hypothetical protein
MNLADMGHNMLCPYEDEKQRQGKEKAIAKTSENLGRKNENPGSAVSSTCPGDTFLNSLRCGESSLIG